MPESPTKFSLACNFDPELFGAVNGYPVFEVFGKLTTDILGGGRPSSAVPAIGKARVRDSVRQAHASGIQFNYLINASCTGNIEFTRQGMRGIRRLLDWLSGIGVDSVTLNHPMLLRIDPKFSDEFVTACDGLTASIERGEF